MSSQENIEGKACTKCGEWKEFSEYNKTPTGKDGLFTYCKTCASKASLARYHRTKHEEKSILSRSRAERKRAYGISEAECQSMWKKQRGNCYLCGEPMQPFGKNHQLNACIEHCHITNRIRGIAHARCNNFIGRFKDDVVIMQRILNNLKRANKKIKDSLL